MADKKKIRQSAFKRMLIAFGVGEDEADKKEDTLEGKGQMGPQLVDRQGRPVKRGK